MENWVSTVTFRRQFLTTTMVEQRTVESYSELAAILNLTPYDQEILSDFVNSFFGERTEDPDDASDTESEGKLTLKATCYVYRFFTLLSNNCSPLPFTLINY